MLLQSCPIMSARLANRLIRTALHARDKGDYEIVGILYVRKQRIECARLLKNLSSKPMKFECSGKEYKKALSESPPWATSTIFFHSHPITEAPSCSDVQRAKPGLHLIFSCTTNSFNLFRYSRSLRQESKKRTHWKNPTEIIKMCQIPMYIETGIKSFDDTIELGRKHPKFINTLRNHVLNYLQKTVGLMNKNGSEIVQTEAEMIQENKLERLFDGLEQYVQFTNGEKAKKSLMNLGVYEANFLQAAYDIFYSLSSYTISQKTAWITSDQ